MPFLDLCEPGASTCCPSPSGSVAIRGSVVPPPAGRVPGPSQTGEGAVGRGCSLALRGCRLRLRGESLRLGGEGGRGRGGLLDSTTSDSRLTTRDDGMDQRVGVPLPCRHSAPSRRKTRVTRRNHVVCRLSVIHPLSTQTPHDPSSCMSAPASRRLHIVAVPLRAVGPIRVSAGARGGTRDAGPRGHMLVHRWPERRAGDDERPARTR